MLLHQLYVCSERKALLLSFKEGLLQRGISRNELKPIIKELNIVDRMIKSISTSLLSELINRHTNRRFKTLISGHENFLGLHEDYESYILIQDISFSSLKEMSLYSTDIVYISKNNMYSVFRLMQKYRGSNGLAFFDQKWCARVERCMQ